MRSLWARILDPFRWVKDGILGFLLGFLGVLLLGSRPRGCAVIAIRTSEGEFHGCGRACRYGKQKCFAPLCRHSKVRTIDGQDLALCGAGRDPVFALPPAAFVSLVALFLGTLLALGLLLLGTVEARVPQSPGKQPSQAAERAAPVSIPAARMPHPLGSSPAVNMPRATPLKGTPMPSALERFRLIQKQSAEATPGDSASPETKPDGTEKDAATK